MKKVNDITLRKYLENVGIELNDGVDSATVPLMVDYGDGGKPVAIAIYHTNEDGSAVCGGETPQGMSLSVGGIDREGIMETSKSTIEQALGSEETKNLLIFPCISRYLMLSPNSDDELNQVIDMIDGRIPYSMAYAGGEICPVKDGSGKYYNRIHNYTFVSCALN
ncbi:MAG: FIST C-terminal domain-containing protein [Oscillospiraceae bacterium]|nr:FIST C-terminal domain-containing protein [Oscillospiraceae bacterium]